jgi:hypothetical protein
MRSMSAQYMVLIRMTKIAVITQKSIHTNRWYLCIFCWALDWFVHAQHTIAIFLAEQGFRKPEWKKYKDKHPVCHDFQIDCGISLLNYGISLEWDGILDKTPSHVQKGGFQAM